MGPRPTGRVLDRQGRPVPPLMPRTVSRWRSQCQQAARPVWRQGPGHGQHRVRHDGHRHELQSLDPARGGQIHGRGHHGEEHERDSGWQSEADPGCKPARNARPPRPDGDAQLAAGRTRQELAEGHQVREALLVEPATALDVLPSEVPDVRDRPAERGQPQPQRRREDLRHRAGRIRCRRRSRRPRRPGHSCVRSCHSERSIAILMASMKPPSWK